MKGSNIRRWGAALAVVIIAGAAYWFWHDRGTSGSGAPAAGQGPQGPGGARHGRFGAALAPVQAATATEEAVPRYLTGLGTVTAANTVTVRSRVDGQLLSLHFQEGQQVKAGDLLAQIDPSQFKVALAQAQGQLAKDQATLANANEKLRPGMFANVAAVLPQKDRVLCIPATAVLYAPYGDSVFVIEDQKDATSGKTTQVLRQQFVRLGRTMGDFVAIVDGLKEGQQVVTTGVFKLRNGAAVIIDNKLAPAALLTPKPSDS